MAWNDYVREIPDFPVSGVLFRDILPVMAHPEAWDEALSLLEACLRPLAPDVILAPEARGFLIGAPLADRLGAGFVAVRKPGKLPGPVFDEAYTLEYGENHLQVESLTRLDRKRAVLVDDVLATGGTASAGGRLARRLGAVSVDYAFLIELQSLKGRSRIQQASSEVISLWTLD